jgi:hypothetical protein
MVSFWFSTHSSADISDPDRLELPHPSYGIGSYHLPIHNYNNQRSLGAAESPKHRVFDTFDNRPGGPPPPYVIRELYNYILICRIVKYYIILV